MNYNNVLWTQKLCISSKTRAEATFLKDKQATHTHSKSLKHIYTQEQRIATQAVARFSPEDMFNWFVVLKRRCFHASISVTFHLKTVQPTQWHPNKFLFQKINPPDSVQVFLSFQFRAVYQSHNMNFHHSVVTKFAVGSHTALKVK